MLSAAISVVFSTALLHVQYFCTSTVVVFPEIAGYVDESAATSPLLTSKRKHHLWPLG